MTTDFDTSEFTDEMQRVFFDSIGIDYGNNSVIPVNVEYLEGYDKRNKFVKYLIENFDVKEGDDVTIYQEW